ncbi:neurogenic locus notch homolog protein 1-like [Haliotis rubra]|uniref:neurogenic locus notch homolog protein 1-like n=1 Tax=Haliotis rubra TaxID=36100 RepID=UPI001EE59268|nr:neurogenic locus notch homolog protein 1-like [Haliotis rubra]
MSEEMCTCFLFIWHYPKRQNRQRSPETESITPCSGTAKLMIRFDSFQNTGFLKEDGKCCDGESRNGNCTGQCDYGVNICLSRNATGDPCEIETFDVGSVDVDTSSFNFPLTFISGFANPLPITLDSWQGNIIVTITISDADTEREERVDSFNFTYTKQEPISSRSVVRGDFQDYTLTGKRSILPTRLDAAVAVQCDRFFYGDDCSINCVENDDCNGHYTCNPITGAKICNDGWAAQQCANSAECVRYGNGFSDFYCCCAPGFTGDNCEIDVDECASSPCENGGSCSQDEPNSYSCTCPIRFKGQKCEIQRTCDDNPCLNGGDCRPVFGSFFCICDPRFTGDVCETLITTTPATTTPACPANFYGPSCSVYCEGRDDCGGHYTCDSQDGNRICNPTWGGVNCTERTVSDATCPCQNGGQCFQSQCCCPQEFTGSLCEFRVRCTPDRCLNGGQCYEEANGFRCDCARGFTGENCETELTTPDPAAACPTDYFGPTCSVFCRAQEDCNAGQWNCHPMTGERLCRFGWRGEFCNQRDPRAQHDVICPNSQCRNGGLCTNSTCCCPIGYTGSLCHIEILECASSPCRNAARCEDLIGDYLCVCSQGYAGRNCEIYIGGSITTQEPDPCMSINCQNGGTCVSNSSSETICLCPEGFRGDLCAETTPRPSATPGCPESYYGPNCLTYCKEEDTCEGGHYYCDPSSGRKLCRSGWIGTICNSRVLLQEIDPECPAVGCKNQGQCFNGSCCCHATSRGEYCQEEILACTRNPCGNGGTCKDLTNGYNCSCSPGYSGINCETFIGFPPGYSSTTASSVSTGSSTSTLESCDEVKCLNGGFCVHVVLPFSCVCIYPFSGEYCEIDMSITTTTDSGIVTGQTPTSVIRTIYLRGNVSDSSQAALEQIIQAALNRSIASSSCCPLVYILQKTTYMGPRGDIIVGYVYNFTHTGGSVISGMTPEEVNNFSNEVDIGLQGTNPFNQNGVLVYRGPTPSLVNLRYTYTVDFVGDISESRRQSVIADIEAAWRNANPGK